MNINLVSIFFAGLGLIAFFLIMEVALVLLISSKRYTFDKQRNTIKTSLNYTIYGPIIVMCECFRASCFFVITALVGLNAFSFANGGENKMIVVSSWLFLLAIYAITEHNTENGIKRIIFLIEKKCGKKLALNHGFTEVEINARLSLIEQSLESLEKAFTGLKFLKE